LIWRFIRVVWNIVLCPNPSTLFLLYLKAARYDPTKVARSLRQKCTTVHGQFDWDLLGREVGCCFNAIPGNVTFFSGPIAGEYKPKERKQRAPRSKDEEEVSYQLMLIINKLLRSV
jgi:hypothetical protein